MDDIVERPRDFVGHPFSSPFVDVMVKEAADEIERLRGKTEWQSIDTAPRDGTNILLFTTDLGVVEAWYSAGTWSDETPEHPREYEGPMWVCADDAFEIEVEEGSLEGGKDHHGTATHWMSLPEPPKGEE